MITVEQFNGPLKRLDIAHWLTSCEDYCEHEASGSLTDKDKIHAAGRVITYSGKTESLHDWFVENRSELEEQTWEEFKEALKDEALGKGWRIHTLKDFFTTTHESKTLEEYFKALDHKRFLLKRNVPFLEPLHGYLYKCYLLFHAPPALVDQVLKDQVYYDDKNFMLARPADVKAWLRKYDDVEVAPSAAVSEIVKSGMYMHSNMIGTESTGIPALESYEFNFSGPDKRIPFPYSLLGRGNVASYSLSLDPGEYITSVKVAYKTYQFGNRWDAFLPAITGIGIVSSNPNKALSVGNLSRIDGTITAPSGWRIIGFYGTYNDNQAHMKSIHRTFRLVSRLGAILALV